METKDIIYELRTKKGFSQEELAEKVFVTRQAVLPRELQGEHRCPYGTRLSCRSSLCRAL